MIGDINKHILLQIHADLIFRKISQVGYKTLYSLKLNLHIQLLLLWHSKMQYDKLPIVMDQFNLLGIPPKKNWGEKNLYFEKTRPLSAEPFYSVY